MTETQERVVNAMREMVGEVRYSKITVNELCLRARISRNTFYANFEDKEDVVRFIFETSVIQPIRDLNRILDVNDLEPLMGKINERMYESIAEDGEFFQNLIGPMRGIDDTFIRVVTRSIYALNKELLPKMASLKDEWKIDYSAYFFASSQAMFMQKWISDGMQVSPKDLAEFYESMAGSFWRSVSR